MRLGRELIHYKYMMEYARSPSYFGLDSSYIESVLVEPIWYQEREDGFFSGQERSLCDIVFLQYGFFGVPVEVKSSRASRSKALSQVEEGVVFLQQKLYRSVREAYVAYYNDDSYERLLI